MLMGLRFVGELLLYQEDFRTNHDQVFHIFGPVMECIPNEDHFSCNILFNLIKMMYAGHNIYDLPDQ